MVISFAKEKLDPPPIEIDGESIERVAKLVGLHIQDKFKWDVHIENIVKKARSKLYFLQKLKRSGAPSDHLIHFYTSVIIPQLEYAAPAWSTSITKEQQYCFGKHSKEGPKHHYARTRMQTGHANN